MSEEAPQPTPAVPPVTEPSLSSSTPSSNPNPEPNASNAPSVTANAPVPPPPPPTRELKVEDALLYLDQVKHEFGDRPRIYNEFLEIMKNFKAQTIDTPGVITRVSNLFRGYNNLILGFNTFLPDGYKIELKDIEGSSTPMASGPGIPPSAPAPPSQMSMPPHMMSYPPHGHLPPHPSYPYNSQIPPGVQPQAQAQQRTQPNQPVEFDHAISYVTTIKKRFANEPEIYKQFLEILHTYQKEQRGIKDVLEQVSTLFADHPDLLKEFTYFLPDAVQEQAKERLNRAAADSEMRRQARESHFGSHSVYGNQHDFYMRQQQNMQQALTGQYGRGGYGGQRKQNRHHGYREQKIIDMTKPLNKSKKPRHTYNSSFHPSTPMVYNAGVERQFFDKVRDIMTSTSRDGGAWSEFLKCLDMYSQEVLSRTEMLQLVEDLFGKHHELFMEFKSILSASASVEVVHDDTWYSVPLSEIDFSRCRKCSPSYRALPRDYPNPPCSERAPFESDVLNNIWVSLPVGSEESYTFRHMRKNQYEEALFRCEDERFEIDMVIDSNESALQVLEPLVNEINVLSAQEFLSPDLPHGQYPAAKNTGAGGYRYQYKFDKRTLATSHVNAITRIYGDHGQEILHLLEKNPAKTIPTIYARLKQKGAEFRAARDQLNKRWKDLVEHNYHKSLDHRSFYFRQSDKKLTSTKSLVNELIGAAFVKQEAAIDPRTGKPFAPNALGQPPPPPKIYNSPPHFTIKYPPNIDYAHRDAFKLIMFAVEKSQLSPSDKERAGRMWRDFLGPFFGLDSTWLYGDVEINKPDEILNPIFAIPVGALVATQYGEGTVEDFSDNKYRVKLNYGVAYLNPSVVFCSVLPIETSNLHDQYSAADNSPCPEGVKCVAGTQSLYVFLRLHNLIIQRLMLAKKLSHLREGEAQVSHPNIALPDIPASTTTSSPQHNYDTYVSLLYNNLESHGDSNRYEAQCRQLLGNNAYELFTMDKLVVHAYKQLKSMGDDAVLHHFIQIFRRYNGWSGVFKPKSIKQESSHWSSDEVFFVNIANKEGNGKEIGIEYIESLNEEDEDEEEDGDGETDDMDVDEGGSKRKR